MSEGSVILRVILVPCGSMAPPDFTWEHLAVSSTTPTQLTPQCFNRAHPSSPEATANLGQWASPPSIKHLLTTPPNPVSLPSRAPGQRHGTALPPPLPSFFTAHLIGPVPTGVAVGGHDNHFLKVWDFWSEESRETSKQQQRDGTTPLGVVSSPETALHPNRSHLREPRAMQCPPSPRAEPSPCPPLKDTH